MRAGAGAVDWPSPFGHRGARASRCRHTRCARLAVGVAGVPRSGVRAGATGGRLAAPDVVGRGAARGAVARDRAGGWALGARAQTGRRRAAHRLQPRHPARARTHRTCRAHRFRNPRGRRVWHGERTRRAPDSRSQSPSAGPVRGGQLRRDRRVAARSGVVRDRGPYRDRRPRTTRMDPACCRH